MTEAEPPRRTSRRRGTRIIIVALVALLLGLGVAAIAIVASNGKDSTDSKESTVDTFHRNANSQSLGSAPDGPQWTAVLGTWGISDNAAVVTKPDPTTNVAIAALPSSQGTVRLEVADVVSGSGLVFRYQDPSSYWELIAAPKFLTWQIYRVEQGHAKFVGNTGTYSSIDDSTLLEVRTQGPLIEISVGGHVRKKMYDDYAANASAAGMVAAGKDADKASFSRFAFESS
jgi:hypothetical protein